MPHALDPKEFSPLTSTILIVTPNLNPDTNLDLSRSCNPTVQARPGRNLNSDPKTAGMFGL